MANVLHVLEVARRARCIDNVFIDWTLKGTERGFKYGNIGDNVWNSLFGALAAAPRNNAYVADSPLDYAFWGTGKETAMNEAWIEERAIYHSIAKRVFSPNSNICSLFSNINSTLVAGRYCIGAHRRVGNAMVANVQKGGRIVPIESFLFCIKTIASRLPTANYCVFLATDDNDAAEAFIKEFGTRLILQSGVRRTSATGQEVHYGDWGKISASDAEQVLVDALMLSSCNVMVHTSSSVSTMAAILNPALILVRPD